MSATERFNGRRYDIVAFARGEKTVYYDEDGDPGEGGRWVLVGRGSDGFSIYHGDLGYRCNWCRDDRDAFGQEFDPDFTDAFDPQRTVITRQRAIEFTLRHNLQPFVTVPDDALRSLCEQRTLVEILPRNVRRAVGEPEWMRNFVVDAAHGITAAVKLEMGWPLVVEDVVLVKNQDLQSRALATIGHARFVDEAEMEIRHRDVHGVLLQVQDLAFVQVTDPSTSRHYVLRVPHRMRSVRQAIAWTFGFEREDDYSPIEET